MSFKYMILTAFYLVFATFLVAQNAENSQETAKNSQESIQKSAKNSQIKSPKNAENSKTNSQKSVKNSQNAEQKQTKNSQKQGQKQTKNAPQTQIQFSKIRDFESYFKALQSDFEAEKIYNPFFDETYALNLQAIAGKKAKINEQWYEKGDVVQGFVIREVSATRSQIRLENPTQAHAGLVTLGIKGKNHKIKIKEYKKNSQNP